MKNSGHNMSRIIQGYDKMKLKRLQIFVKYYTCNRYALCNIHV